MKQSNSKQQSNLASLEVDFLRAALENPSLIKTNDKDWLTHIKPVVTAARPTIEINKNTRLSMEQLFSFLGTSKVLEGGYTTEQVRLVYRILATHNRSDYVVSQSKNTQHSSAVPIIMAAYRDKYQIKYSSWIHDHIGMSNAILGKTLSEVLEVKEYLDSLGKQAKRAQKTYDTEMGDSEYEDMLGIESPSHEPIDVFDFDFRVDLKNRATKNGSILDTGYATIKRVFKPDHPLGSEFLSKFYWHMLTQTWIFSPSIRHRDMITNLQDFDVLDPSLTPLTNLEDKSNPSKKSSLLDW